MIYLNLFLTFAKIGLFTIGGGYAMLPLIQSEVLANAWLTQEELLNFIAVSESTPGPFAINIATYVGTIMGGPLGSICATLGVVTPSFVIILIVARLYQQFQRSKVVSGLMSGLKPAALGLIAASVISLFFSVFIPASGPTFPALVTQPLFWISLVIFISAIIAAFKKVHPILIIVLAAGIGIASGYILGL